MKSVFSLFENYEDCKAAVDDLLQEGFDEEEMNVIVDEELAKTHMDVNLEHVVIKATDEIGEEATGLDVLLGVEQPVVIPRLGSVYAAGEIATFLAKTAQASDIESVENTIAEFGIPRSIASSCIETILDGGVLFWVRTSDEQAPKAGEIFRAHNGFNIVSHGR